MKKLILAVLALSLVVPVALVSAQDTGIWTTHEFVDEFGDPTGEKFISSSRQIIGGTFSNSVVGTGQLRVLFIISKDNFGLRFFEDYFGMTNNVASTLFVMNSATVSVRDKDSNTIRLRGTVPGMTGQQLYVTPFADIISVLKKGGLVRFSINIENLITYRFDIPNANHFDQAFELIGGSVSAAPEESGGLRYRAMGEEDFWSMSRNGL